MTRRDFLHTAAALPLATRALAFEPQRAATWLFFGTDKGAGIYRAPWNAATGEIGSIELHVPADRPVYFAHHPTLPIVYVNNELSDGKAGLSAFAAADGKLTQSQRVGCDDGPCYVSCTATHVYSANYAAGSFEAWPLEKDGAIHEPPYALRAPKFKQPGPVPDRQDNPHFHCAVISPNKRHVVVCDLGADRILSVPVDQPGEPKVISARQGTGPRHVAFHPNGKWMYCIHELDCSIDLYDWHDGTATYHSDWFLRLLKPGTPREGNTGCELLISPDGRFAYACTRGVDEIVTFSIDAKTGRLTELQRLSSGGKIPRIITFDPTGRWLIACNQGAPGKVAVFAHDPATAKLTPSHSYDAPTPMCVMWL